MSQPSALDTGGSVFWSPHNPGTGLVGRPSRLYPTLSDYHQTPLTQMAQQATTLERPEHFGANTSERDQTGNASPQTNRTPDRTSGTDGADDNNEPLNMSDLEATVADMVRTSQQLRDDFADRMRQQENTISQQQAVINQMGNDMTDLKHMFGLFMQQQQSGPRPPTMTPFHVPPIPPPHINTPYFTPANVAGPSLQTAPVPGSPQVAPIKTSSPQLHHSPRPPSVMSSPDNGDNGNDSSHYGRKLFDAMLAKLPKLTGAGNPELFLEFLEKADEILLFGSKHISEGEFLSYVKVSASGAAADFLKSLWGDPYLTPHTWHDVCDENGNIYALGLRSLLLTEYKPINYGVIVLN